jgi:hypothetical protein
VPGLCRASSSPSQIRHDEHPTRPVNPMEEEGPAPVLEVLVERPSGALPGAVVVHDDDAVRRHPWHKGLELVLGRVAPIGVQARTRHLRRRVPRQRVLQLLVTKRIRCAGHATSPIVGRTSFDGRKALFGSVAPPSYSARAAPSPGINIGLGRGNRAVERVESTIVRVF